MKFYERVLSTVGQKNANEFVRLYVVPEMGHCGSRVYAVRAMAVSSLQSGRGWPQSRRAGHIVARAMPDGGHPNRRNHCSEMAYVDMIICRV